MSRKQRNAIAAATVMALGCSAALASGDPNGVSWSGNVSYNSNNGWGSQNAGVDSISDTALLGEAQRGNVNAQTLIGLRLLNTANGPASYTQAMAWFRRAASQGYTEAMFHLGVMYANGEGVPADSVEALSWYALAAQGGHQQAAAYARELAPTMQQSDAPRVYQRVQQIQAMIRNGQQPQPNYGATPNNNIAMQTPVATNNPYAQAQPTTPNNPLASPTNPLVASTSEVTDAGFNATTEQLANPLGGATPQPLNPVCGNAQQSINPLGGGSVESVNPLGGNAPQTTNPLGGAAPQSTNPLGGAAPVAAPAADMPTDMFDIGVFSTKVPRGWAVSTAGTGTTFAWVGRDPSNGARQLFAFSRVFPLFTSEQGKQFFGQAMQYSGTQVEWRDIPIVGELSPANFMKYYEQICKTVAARQFFPQIPQWDNIQIISAQPRQSPYDQLGATTALIRARMTISGQPAEGVFIVSVAQSPVQGSGMALGFYGITAPAGQLTQIEAPLTMCLNSSRYNFPTPKSTVASTSSSANAAFEGYQKAYRMRQEASDISMNGWKANNQLSDIGQQRTVDAIRGVERVYDPTNSQTYEFNAGFYQQYDLNRNYFQMNNLQQVQYDPAHQTLLDQAPQNGYRELR